MSQIKQQVLYTIVGTLKLSKDKFLELMEELIQNQHYTEEEGRRITLEFIKNMEAFKKDTQILVAQKLEETKNNIQAPIQEQINTWAKDIKQKIQDYSLKQLLSN